MKSYHTFKNISPSVYEEIKNFIKLRYKIQVLTKTSPGLEEYFDVLDSAVEPLFNDSKNLVPKSYYDVLGWDESN